MTVCCLAREVKFLRLVELLPNQVLMRIAGRVEKLGDKIFFLGRVIERTARGYSVEANPKYIRDVIAVLGLEDSRPVSTRSVKRPTTESLVALENDKRAVHRTAVGGKLLYMCQERADIMYSVKETARKITCPTESDELNVKRIARYLKGVPSATCLIDQQIPSVRERVHRQPLGRTTPNVQEHKRWGHAVRKHDSFCLVKNTAVSVLELCRSSIIRFDNWNFRRDGDETSLERTGIRSDTRKQCRQSICEGIGIQPRFGTYEACNAQVHVRATRRGETVTVT